MLQLFFFQLSDIKKHIKMRDIVDLISQTQDPRGQILSITILCDPQELQKGFNIFKQMQL